MSNAIGFIIVAIALVVCMDKRIISRVTATLSSLRTLFDTNVRKTELVSTPEHAFIKRDLAFLSRYDNHTHHKLHKMINKFLQLYYKSIGSVSLLGYNKYREHTHLIQKLYDIRREVLNTMHDTVYLMSHEDYQTIHRVPEKMEALSSFFLDKIELVSRHLHLRFDTVPLNGVENVSDYASFDV
jgi:hypothetical protein